jgi:hypothetical protein
MENKYYTPEIEEFHVGFEYEIYGTYASNNIEGVWLPVVYEEDLVNLTDDSFTVNLSRFNYRIAKKTIRVKHLDQEDIESLGFINYHNESVDDNIKTFHKAVHNTAIRAKGFDVNILLNVDTNTVRIFDITKGKYQIFVGTIKNKSELKRVLKMLNIN